MTGLYCNGPQLISHMCFISSKEAEGWSSAYGRADGTQHPLWGAGHPVWLVKQWLSPRKVLKPPHTWDLWPTAGVSSMDLHLHVNLFGIIFLFVFLLTTQTLNQRNKHIPHRLLQKCRNCSIWLYMPKGWCFWVINWHLCLAPVPSTQETIHSGPSTLGKAVPSLPALERREGWKPTGQLDLTSSQLTLWASALALLFLPSRDTQYRNSLSASSTLPRVAKACAFLKCAWKKTWAFSPILLHLLTLLSFITSAKLLPGCSRSCEGFKRTILSTALLCKPGFSNP